MNWYGIETFMHYWSIQAFLYSFIHGLSGSTNLGIPVIARLVIPG